MLLYLQDRAGGGGRPQFANSRLFPRQRGQAWMLTDRTSQKFWHSRGPCTPKAIATFTTGITPPCSALGWVCLHMNTAGWMGAETDPQAKRPNYGLSGTAVEPHTWPALRYRGRGR